MKTANKILGFIKRIFSNKAFVIALLSVIVLITLIIVSAGYIGSTKPQVKEEPTTNTVETQPATEKAAAVENKNAHMIFGAAPKVQVQDVLQAGCETYAATVTLNIYGFDLSPITFADHYLDCHEVTSDESGNTLGPDMYSGFAGTAYAGWGVYSPSMAKSMNKYLKDQNSDLKATNYENIPLETLCKEYIDNDIPVMIWATTGMQEPSVYCSWTVNYVDENAKTKIGDTFEWYDHEHCLVLIGYDEYYYYFCDSAAGMVSTFTKAEVNDRYQFFGSQCIVVQ